MKRLIASIVSIFILASFTSCSNNNTSNDAATESTAKIEAAQSAINALHEIGYLDNFYDTLYVDENAEIHHNEWSSAYVTALNAYNALSEGEKEQITNAHWLNEDSYYINAYENTLIEQEIALYCKDAAVEYIKDSLINKSSYEEYGWILNRVFYLDDDHTFSVDLDIEYSATNKIGGRIDDTEYLYIRGRYQPGGIIKIDSIS